jgi:tRNA U55 pseudouridine synthase TruB
VPSSVLLPLLIFFALGLPIVALLWRVFVTGGELRREAQHGRAARDIARRADVSLTELLAVVDELRRGKSGPDVIEASMHASAEALRRYAIEADVIDKHAAPGGALLMPEVERAQRALDLIEHGRELLLDTNSDLAGEGESAVKRGYLNLLHAREAIRAKGEEIATAAVATPRRAARGLGRRR